MSTYSGGSHGKSIVRRNTYNWIEKKQGRVTFTKGKHVVIASRYCGDIAFLVERGIDSSNILPCDIDPQARQEAALWHVPRVGVDIVETTRECIERYGKRAISTVNVDLCCTVGKGYDTVNKVLALGLASHTRVLFTFFKARDGMKGDMPSRVQYLERHIKKVLYSEKYQSTTAPMGTVIF